MLYWEYLITDGGAWFRVYFCPASWAQITGSPGLQSALAQGSIFRTHLGAGPTGPVSLQSLFTRDACTGWEGSVKASCMTPIRNPKSSKLKPIRQIGQSVESLLELDFQSMELVSPNVLCSVRSCFVPERLARRVLYLFAPAVRQGELDLTYTQDIDHIRRMPMCRDLLSWLESKIEHADSIVFQEHFVCMRSYFQRVLRHFCEYTLGFVYKTLHTRTSRSLRLPTTLKIEVSEGMVVRSNQK